MSLPPMSSAPTPEPDNSSTPSAAALPPPPALGVTRSPALGPSAGVVFVWAILGFVALGGAALFQLLSLANDNDLGFGIYAILCFLIGIPLTLVAVILAIVRAVRNRQWRWLLAILIGTVFLPLLPDTLVNAAVYTLAPDYLLPGHPNLLQAIS